MTVPTATATRILTKTTDPDGEEPQCLECIPPSEASVEHLKNSNFIVNYLRRKLSPPLFFRQIIFSEENNERFKRG